MYGVSFIRIIPFRLQFCIIIDNFDTAAAYEVELGAIMNYSCRVIFTTCSNFEIGTIFQLAEISDIDTLISLAGKFYSDIELNRETVVKIIEAVYRHKLIYNYNKRAYLKPWWKTNYEFTNFMEANFRDDRIREKLCDLVCNDNKEIKSDEFRSQLAKNVSFITKEIYKVKCKSKRNTIKENVAFTFTFDPELPR